MSAQWARDQASHPQAKSLTKTSKKWPQAINIWELLAQRTSWNSRFFCEPCCEPWAFSRRTCSETLAEQSAKFLSNSYPEVKGKGIPFDEISLNNFQPCEKVIAVEYHDDVDALEALRLHIDQELMDLSFTSDGGSLGTRDLKKTTSAPDLRNLHLTVKDLETSSVCSVDDLSPRNSPGSVGAVRENGSPSRDGNVKGNMKQSKEWLDTFL